MLRVTTIAILVCFGCVPERTSSADVRGVPDAGAHDDGGSGGTAGAAGSGGGGATGASCGPFATSCEIAAGTPVRPPGYPASDFWQPKFGGHGFIGDDSTRLDGYAAVVTWPSQQGVLQNPNNHVAAWPGLDLEGGWFIQNGYLASEQPCQGLVVTFVFQLGPDCCVDVYSTATEFGQFCDGGPVQFKAERDGTSWAFYYRAVAAGDFVEHGRYDFGTVVRGINPIMAMAEMYDYDDTSPQISPIRLSHVLGKVNDTWRPAERMEYAIDFPSPWLQVRPEPEVVGVTTPAMGPTCYAPGDVLFESDAPCYGTALACDLTTGRCDP